VIVFVFVIWIETGRVPNPNVIDGGYRTLAGDEDLEVESGMCLRHDARHRQVTNHSEGNEVSIYTDNGYKSRMDYLKSLAEDYGVPLSSVIVIADTYGPSEDFDGLVTAVEDLADEMDD